MESLSCYNTQSTYAAAIKQFFVGANGMNTCGVRTKNMFGRGPLNKLF